MILPYRKIFVSNLSECLCSLPNDWYSDASEDLRNLLMSLNTNRATTKHAYLVQQSNLYVSQVA